MQRDDVIDLLGRFNDIDLTKVVLVMKAGGGSINIDTLMRHEKTYTVVRGREAGTNDESRAFFVPYEEISYVRLEKLVRLNELRTLYGDATVASTSLNDADEDAAPAPAPAAGVAAAVTVPVQSAPLDPAAIAKQNLLDRIRAARTSAGKK